MALLTRNLNPLSTTDFDPLSVAEPRGLLTGGIAPVQAPKAPPSSPGLLGRVGGVFKQNPNLGRGLRVVGAGLKDLGTGGNSLEALLQTLDQQRLQQIEQTWRNEQQSRMRTQWTRDDAGYQQQQEQQGRLRTWAEQQGGDALVDPAGAFQANRIANAPLTRDQRMDNERQDAAQTETARHNRAVEAHSAAIAKASAANSANGGLDQDTLRMLAGPVALGAPLPVGMSRSPGMARSIYAEAARQRREGGLSPQTYATAQLAYRGNAGAITDLSKKRASIGVAERTALANLQLAQHYSRNVPRTSIPLINKALLEGQAHIAGDPATVAFYNALQTAREEYAKVLSGNTSASGITDASRKEAERLIRPDMTPDQIDAAIQTATIEMSNRMDSFDQMMAGLNAATQTGALVPNASHEAPPNPTGARNTTAAPSRPSSTMQWTRDANGRPVRAR